MCSRFESEVGDQTLKDLQAMKLFELSSPLKLYHATYRPLIESIMKNGLGGEGAKKQWDDSKLGVVYLATDKHIAESYAESAENVPDDWLDEIVTLTIDVSKIDYSKLSVDKNVQDNDGSTYEYSGVIPVEAISKE